MKRIALSVLSLVLIITGCAPAYEKNEEVGVETTEQSNKEKAIVPKYNISDEYYRPLEEYKPSKSRGVITNQITNRLDIKEMEVGLRRHSKSVYDPKEYYFQEGQYLTDDILYDWLDRSKNNSESDGTEGGLNPAVKENAGEEELRDKPKYLSHILEQDYLKQSKEGNVVQTEGISIGLAMKSQFRFQTEVGGAVRTEDISTDEMMKEAKDIAQTVLERLREMEDLEDVPIMFAIYREEEKGSMVPGNFVAKTAVKGGDMKVGSWDTIEEDHVLFPSEEGKGQHPEDANLISNLQSDVEEYFPNYIGVVGRGFYVDDQLTELTIEIPIEFKGQTEVIGLTQYVYSLIVENFPNYFALEVNIESHDGQEALISREPGQDEPYVHIYGQ